MKKMKSVTVVMLSICLLCIVGCCRSGKCADWKAQAEGEKQGCGCESCKQGDKQGA